MLCKERNGNAPTSNTDAYTWAIRTSIVSTVFNYYKIENIRSPFNFPTLNVLGYFNICNTLLVLALTVLALVVLLPVPFWVIVKICFEQISRHISEAKLGWSWSVPGRGCSNTKLRKPSERCVTEWSCWSKVSWRRCGSCIFYNGLIIPVFCHFLIFLFCVNYICLHLASVTFESYFFLSYLYFLELILAYCCQFSLFCFQLLFEAFMKIDFGFGKSGCYIEVKSLAG